MKKLLITFVVLASCTVVNAQLNSDGFKTTPIEKAVGEFPLKIDLSTPLDLYLSAEYIITTGQDRLWDQISSYQNKSGHYKDAPDREVSEEQKQQELDQLVCEVVVYKDAVAAVITSNEIRWYKNKIRWCRLEDGRWVNTREDIAMSLDEARVKVALEAESWFGGLAVIERLKQIPHDTAPFLAHLKTHGQSPEDFLLDALSGHKIVIWGEVHRRKWSWDVLKSAVRDRRFAKTVGTVFVELPSHAQARMDKFFAGNTMDTGILLGIFRDEQIFGWFDRGEFEFLTELWRLNKTLPAAKKIKVVLADFQIPYSDINSPEEYKNHIDENRNTHMADVVERTVRSSSDKRNNLFTVGFAHAYKSHVPGLQGSVLTAGAQLAERFPGDEVFTIFQHIARMTNSGGRGGLIREGVFDRAFAAAGDVPVGFALADSPFGAEPFDASMEIMYSPLTGSFADNFDGYIFLGPLVEEDGDYEFYDMIDEGFVGELKRRAAYTGADGWFGIKLDELTPERIIEFLEKYAEGKRWAGAFEN